MCVRFFVLQQIFYIAALFAFCHISWTNYGVLADVDIDVNRFSVDSIQQQLPFELGKTNFSLEDVKTIFRNKCVEVAGEENGTAAYNEIESGFTTLTECINEIVNYTAIQAEIDEASPKGELDVVFNKYCGKRPRAFECFDTYNAKLVPCLDKEERESQDVAIRIVRSLLNFVCHKGGDQIALFIAEKGPECLESKKDDIQQCINSTFAGYLPKDGFDNIKTLPKLVMSQKQCDEIVVLETCIVERLENCPDITPANIVESMFRFIKNETICRITGDTSAAKQSAGNTGTHNANIGGFNTIFILMWALYLILMW